MYQIGKSVISTGDTITVRLLASQATGTVIEAEKYRDAYIVRYRTAKGAEAIVCPFPDLPELPALVVDPDLYICQAWVEFGEHIWPAPVAQPRQADTLQTREIEGDPVGFAKRKIDHIMSIKRFINGDLRVYPNNEEERKLFNKWWR